MPTGLRDLQKQHGAELGPFDGVELPLRFTQPEVEWAAVRQRCGLLDAGFRSLLRMTGGDRVTFLQGMVSNDVAVLRPAEGTYAAFLTIQGRVVSDLRIYATSDELWLDVPVGRVEAVREGLERYIIADDVELADPSGSTPIVVLEGPLAPRTLLAVIGESPSGLTPYSHRAALFDGAQVQIAAVSHSGEPGFMVMGDPTIGPDLWEHCWAAGAEPVGMNALDVLRVEGGIPWYGREMDDSTLISEVGLESAISFTKGCYLGQEVVERVAARGQVQRKLVGLLCEGHDVPAPESTLFHDTKNVGSITSAAWSPLLHSVIALAYVRREAWTPGTELSVTTPASSTKARVAELPFYRRDTNEL